MSAISGFYVHYFASNATKDGLISGDTIFQYAQIRASRLATTLQSKVSTSYKQQYANILNGLFNRKSAQENMNVQSAIQQLAQEKFNKAVDIDFITGRVTKALSDNTGTIDAPEVAKMVNVPSLVWTQERVEALQKTTQAALNALAAQPNATQLASLINKFSTLKTQFDLMYRNCSSSLSKLSSTAATQAKRLINNSKLPQFNTKTKWVNANIDLVNEMNNLISATFITNNAANIEQGDVFEWMAYYASQLAAGKALDSVYDTIEQGLSADGASLGTMKSGVYGGVRGDLNWSIGGIDSKVLAKTFLKDATTRQQIGSLMVTTKKTAQQKIDFIGTFADDTGTKIQVPVSAKSTNLSQGIKVVGGTSLWTLLQGEPLYYFNSFFNIMAEHTHALSYMKRYDYLYSQQDVAEETQALAELQQERQDAISSAQLLSIVKAVSGTTFLRMGAQLMVINDTASQQVYVLEMSDIIEALIKQSLIGASGISKYVSGLNIIELTYKNNRAETKEARVAKIINQAHARKISLTIKGSFFKAKNLAMITSI